MTLTDLIEALATEVEAAQGQLADALAQLARLDAEDEAFLDALDQYSGLSQRMGEAADMAGFSGLQTVCNLVLENSLALATLGVSEREPLVTFLRSWPPLIVHYLRNLNDPSTVAGLMDHLGTAPYPLEPEQSDALLRTLAELPGQLDAGGLADGRPERPTEAQPADVALQVPADTDPNLLGGFLHEAPGQVQRLVELALKMACGTSDAADLTVAKRVAHTLKGSGAIIGLRGLTSLGHHLEDILEYAERLDGPVPRVAADALVDAAYCLEQMVGHVAGHDEFPQQAQAVLQQVLDVAHRMDRGEDLMSPQEGAGARPAPQVARKPGPTAPETATDAAAAEPMASLRVNMDRIDELFRVSGEISVQTSSMEERLRRLGTRTRELLAQQQRIQQRLFELETQVDVRSLTMVRTRIRSRRDDAAGFDPLEMDQYSDLHSTTHALMEEAADARVLALRLEEDLLAFGAVQTQQQRLAKDLQHLVIGTRMTEVNVLAPRLQRNVRATCQATGKQATLQIVGGSTLIDSDVLNRLAEPLMHILRNAVDHGLEHPAERQAVGKSPSGLIVLQFSRQGQLVVLRCQDDGAGLDVPAIRQRAVQRGLIDADEVLDDDTIAQLILLPGFSTRAVVSEVSGRGVGLDVVHHWANAMNGSVRVESEPGRGCVIELRFAATLSTIQSLVVEVSGQRLALPSHLIEQAVPRGVGTFEVVDDELKYRHGDRLLTARLLAGPTGLPLRDGSALNDHDAVIVQVDGRTVVLGVDRLLESRDLLVKDPGPYARHLRGVMGLSILGDGGVVVNLDLAHLLAPGLPSGVLRGDDSSLFAANSALALPRVLVVDDSLSVRNSLMQLVQDAGYAANAVRDGVEAVRSLQDNPPDLVLTDLEMPNMNGIELTRHIRARDDLGQVPVIMITSRSQDKHQRLAADAGVTTYLTKPYSDGDLLRLIRETLASRTVDLLT